MSAFLEREGCETVGFDKSMWRVVIDGHLILLSAKQDFHHRYRGIVGGLGHLVTVTRPDLAWSYSELSKYVQFSGIAHMEAAEHVLRYLRDT